MGNGGGKHEIIREYVQDPVLLQQLAELQKTNAQLMAEFSKISESIKSQGLEDKIESFEDLKRFDEKAASALVTLAQKAPPLEMKGQNFGFFGLTSTGKSSIINKLLGKDVAEIGAGETTTVAAPYEGTNYTLYDIPGRNDEMSYFSMEYISFWKGLTGRLVVITATIKEMTKVLSLLDAIDLKYDIVINKFDNVPAEEREAFKQKIQAEVQKHGLKGVGNIWYVSAKNPDQFGDWLQMVNYLTN